MQRNIAIIAGLFAAAAAGAAFADITVGITISATGPAAALGGPQKNTAALLPAEIAGQKIRYIVLDDATDPTAATRNAKKLTAEDHADILIGGTTTANSLAVLNVAAETGTPQISLAPFQAPADKFAWAFQTPQSNTLMAGAVVDHMKSNGVKTVGYIGFSDPFGESWFNAFKPLLDAAKIELVANERFNRTDTSVTAQILKIASANPDAVMIGASGTPGMLPHITLADRGYKGKIYHTHGVANKAVLTLGGAKLDGAFVPMGPGMVAELLGDAHPSKKPALEYIAAYEKAHGADSRTTFGAHLWDAMLIVRAALPEALKSGQPGTPAFRMGLRDAIEKAKDVAATQGVFTYTPTDHAGLDKRAWVLTRVEKSNWKLLPGELTGAPAAPKRRPRGTLFAPAAVELERRADGTLLMRSPVALGAYADCVGDWLEAWAGQEPDRAFLVERGGMDQWREYSYGEVSSKVAKLAAGLLRRKLGPERPLIVLSENSVEHALLMLAAMQIGVPVAPLSPAYSLQSKDFAKLKAIVALLEPGMIFAADETRYGPALAAIRDLHSAEIVIGTTAMPPREATPLAALYVLGRTADVAVARERVGPDTIAKFLFTSGSTGEPKAVINTHRMLCSNQQAKLAVWPFLAHEPPVIVDWLPWSHTFGGNHNFDIVLKNGGTLYIDTGKPVPGLFERTVANLHDIAPTVYFNVPRGYDMLVSALDADAALSERFFSRLKVIFYAGAALPQHLWDALGAASERALGRRVPMVTSFGSTETAPLATDCHYQAPRPGVVGIPVPGTELKLIPLAASSPKMEIRVRGPNVTPGYWKHAEATAAAFDEEGFYRIGDAVRFLDAAKPERGLVFDGRIAEDFKLSSGTTVHVGSLRMQGIAALAPVAQDIVVTGHDRDDCGFMVFPNLAACRALAGLADEAPDAEVIDHPAVVERVRAGLAALRGANGGSSTFAARALLLAEPASSDAGEITDKGYINQRAVRERRAPLVGLLHGEPSGADPSRVIALDN